MTLDLTCTECEASFELDVQTLLDDPKTLACTNCDAKASARKAEALATAIDDLLTAMTELAPKFTITLSAETDDLPAEEPEEEEEETGSDEEPDEDEDEGEGEDDDEKSDSESER